MEEKYRVMANDENGENVINDLFSNYEIAEAYYDKQIKKDFTKEVVLDKVFFDNNGEWLENNDEGILAWREEGY